MKGHLGRALLAVILTASRRTWNRVRMYYPHSPVTMTFLTSDCPGLLFNDALAHPHLDSTPFVFRDTVSNDFPNTYPVAQRSIPVPYEPPYCT